MSLSRVGSKIIKVPDDVIIKIEVDKINISGPKGSLVVKFIDGINCELKDKNLSIKCLKNDKCSKINHGTVRANINNAIIGVTKGFEKKLEIRGIGYRANMQDDKLCLHIGFSHLVYIKPKNNSKIICKDATNIIVEGIDKQAVGQTAALIRNVRPPEPYKGKGIRYFGEFVPHKEGKRAATTATSTATGAKKK